MKRAWICLLLPALAGAAVWPETIGPWKRTAQAPVTVSDRPLWDEFGLKEAERATYENGDLEWNVTGYRMADPTSAMGAFQWQRPAEAKESKLAPLAAETAAGAIIAHGNFLFVFERRRPSPEEFSALAGGLRNLDTSPLPAFTTFMPSASRIPGGDRFILGPASLEKFAPGIPPSVAAFSLGAEAQSSLFRTAKGELRMTVFNYPTPQIAMQKVLDFQKVTGLLAKRSGPLVAAIASSSDPDAAERLLGQVRWEAQVTLAERMPTRRDNIGDLVINAFILIGFLLGFSLVAGLSYGGLRAIRMWRNPGPEPEAMISLNLQNR
jgi:hypothetical protein